MLYIIVMPKFRDDKKRGERPKKARGGVRAARNYLRLHLGWLAGFPIGCSDGVVHWQSVVPLGSSKPCEILHIDREILRKAVYARNAARRKFPHALQEVVGDVDQWTRHTDQRFELLKQVVHEGQPLPDLDDLMATRRVRTSTRERCRAVTGQYQSPLSSLSSSRFL